MFQRKKNSEKNKEETEKEILQEICQTYGPRISQITIGGAQIAPIVENFLRRCFPKCSLSNIYGTTELGAIAINNLFRPDLQFKLIPWQTYLPSDWPFPRGELAVKRTVNMGKLNASPELPQSELEWYPTGDIVELIGSRSIRIIDRKSTLFKLSTGRFVKGFFI